MRGRGRWLLLLASSACSVPSGQQPAPLNQLGARASFDLECPLQWLALNHVDEHVKGVEGCGRRAVYIEVCSGSGAACVWWLNSMSRTGAAGQGAPPVISMPPPASSVLRDRE